MAEEENTIFLQPFLRITSSSTSVPVTLLSKYSSGFSQLQVNTFKLLYSANDKITESRERLNELFGKYYPSEFTPDCINYYEDSADELAIINYTSGTSGFSKGVMIPYRAVSSNIEFAQKVLPQINSTSRVVVFRLESRRATTAMS